MLTRAENENGSSGLDMEKPVNPFYSQATAHKSDHLVLKQGVLPEKNINKLCTN